MIIFDANIKSSMDPTYNKELPNDPGDLKNYLENLIEEELKQGYLELEIAPGIRRIIPLELMINLFGSLEQFQTMYKIEIERLVKEQLKRD